MNDGRRHFGPRRQISAGASADCAESGALHQSKPVGSSLGTPARAAGAREPADDTGDRPFLPSAAAANALLEARARAKGRVEHANIGLDSLQYLRASDLCRLLRISKPTLWRLRRTRGFPEPTEVTDRLIAWRRSEVEEWLGRVASARRLPVTASTPRSALTENVTSRSSVPKSAKPSAARPFRKRSRPAPPDEQLTLPFKSVS